MKAELFSQFEFLRAHIESTVERSAAIMLTSAKPGDGKSFTAHGLAERLADSGRRVVLVEFQACSAAPPTQRALDRIRAFPIVTLPPDDEGSQIATTMLRAHVEELRGAYDYTIIDGAPLLHSRIATILSSVVDAILVAVRLGRTSDGDDAALVEALGRTGASVLGVVAAAPKDIADFGERSVSGHPGDVTTPLLKATNFPALERSSMPAFEGTRR